MGIRMHLPKKLQKYLKKAEQLIHKGLVRDIEFSGATYQVYIVENALEEEEGYWAFIQLDPKGEIKDSFCACEESEAQGGCVHVAAGFLRIFNGRERPLHSRFRDSLWNELCTIFFFRLGDKQSEIIQNEKSLFYCKENDKLIFSIEAKTPESSEKLRNFFIINPIETEETSLKFSNLTEDDLNLWRQGKPGPQLRYELSFWNEIAKKMMILQDERNIYSISFGYTENKIPNSIKIFFREYEFYFDLREEDLIRIIPFLSSVNSPLSVHTTQREAIQQITYDNLKGELNVELKEEYSSEKKDFEVKDKKYLFGGWNYVPGEGFYAVDQYHILARPKITGERLSDVLDTHAHVIKKLLKYDHLSEEPVNLSYSLRFDKDWNLHIEEYLFDKGDLSGPEARLFGRWVYQPKYGFFPIESRLFNEIETIILSDDVHSFVSGHRLWLNTIEGFETHLTSIEVNIRYKVTPEGNLLFKRLLTLDDEETDSKDFGTWVYITGRGFYYKISAAIGLSIDPDIPVSKTMVSGFIKKNREELALIPNFFSKENPLLNACLEVKVLDDQTIAIEPVYTFFSERKQQSGQFFDDFLYIEGEGFYEIPLKFRLPENYRTKSVLSDNEELTDFFENDLPAFSHRIHLIEKKVLEPSELFLEIEKITIPKNSSRGIYEFHLNFISNSGSANISSIRKTIEEGKRYSFTDAGRIDTKQLRFRWIEGIEEKNIDFENGTVRMSALEFFRINAFEDIRLKKSKGKDYTASKNILESLLNTCSSESIDLSLLKSALRPYQDMGLKWLWFLYLNNLSGLLCDDMGLGKTHQAMALLAASTTFNRMYDPKKKIHFLIICPTSVIYHWQDKLETFLPDLRVCVFHGLNRSLRDFTTDYDILLTSYGIWRNEVFLLKKVDFEIAIFDEMQVAKNHTSGIHRSLLKVNAKMKVGLSGTPIENRLRELKSLFDITLPGYFPGEKEYNDFFVKPIEKDGDPEKKALLIRQIKPFFLRRKKEGVLRDLPAKTEEVAHCELLPEQFALYNEVLKVSHKKLLDELQNEHNPVPYIHIFALLTNLKQICNHPALYFKDPDNYTFYQSGKWNLFTELLSEARESGQKVVVFSQYLFMLDIIEKYLKESSIQFAGIRGSTVKRGEEIKKFNTDPACEVFVGSLQATGLGIDLTAGSVVIHYDRWWNAAREDQATDRVHRIGQKRGVQVFKLVTKNTFEEKIDELITKKGKLMEDIIGSDDHSFVKKFSREELAELLAYVEW